MNGSGTRDAVLGFDLGGTRIKIGLVDREGTVHRFRTVPTDGAKGKEHLLSTLREACHTAGREASAQGFRLLGTGIGTAGFVDGSGRVAYATENLPGWTGTELRRELESATDLPAVALNDVHAMALGELWLGTAASLGLRSFVCVALGTGIGGCIIEDGRIFGGRDGHAGGFGHQIVMREGGIPCGCGMSGCWESYASVNALKRLIDERAPQGFFEAPACGVEDGADVVADGGTPIGEDRGADSTAHMGADRGADDDIRTVAHACVHGDDTRIDVPTGILRGMQASKTADPRVLFDAARAGGRLALEIVDEYAARVAAGLVNLIHTLNAGDFIIGGAIAAQGDFLLARIAERVDRQIMPVYRGSGIRLHAASLGDHAGVAGAAFSLLRQL
ncbi:ROK family protein [Saccharibacillus alkalitolerans]|uniref:ROK family protein n=1 Tax=Saccharibacillus alkalitolerans TaxID=2705290 RepID=A0ABX0F1U2_9BACL|nr:ROK family protein [Saccharibacillus alkalitolerans]NGZ74947.1 ROK family protein [Saccharibacillus alkalitolerans]